MRVAPSHHRALRNQLGLLPQERKVTLTEKGKNTLQPAEVQSQVETIWICKSVPPLWSADNNLANTQWNERMLKNNLCNNISWFESLLSDRFHFRIALHIKSQILVVWHQSRAHSGWSSPMVVHLQLVGLPGAGWGPGTGLEQWFSHNHSAKQFNSQHGRCMEEIIKRAC